jgi:transcriptional regulator with XRE-family HTH domain
LNSLEKLVEQLREGKKERARFVASHVDKGIAYQIRALRDRQELSQEKLAEMVGMNQNAISRIESPYRGRPTITTLKRLAEAFDVALVVRFVPFSKLAKWISGTPYLENGLSTDGMAVPSFEEEDKTHQFDAHEVASTGATALKNLIGYGGHIQSGAIFPKPSVVDLANNAPIAFAIGKRSSADTSPKGKNLKEMGYAC